MQLCSRKKVTVVPKVISMYDWNVCQRDRVNVRNGETLQNLHGVICNLQDSWLDGVGEGRRIKTDELKFPEDISNRLSECPDPPYSLTRSSKGNS